LKRIRQIPTDSQYPLNAFDNVESAAKLANETKHALEKQLAEIKEFLENERASPEAIQSVVDEVLAITIPFTDEKIRELSEQVINS
jgi:hypothetical protein